MNQYPVHTTYPISITLSLLLHMVLVLIFFLRIAYPTTATPHPFVPQKNKLANKDWATLHGPASQLQPKIILLDNDALDKVPQPNQKTTPVMQKSKTMLYDATAQATTSPSKKEPLITKASTQSPAHTNQPSAEPIVPPAPAKPKLTLADLAKGFIRHTESKGNFSISMQGTGRAQATQDQLRIGRYLQKIIWAIQNAWNINKSSYPFSEPMIVSINFILYIQKNGTLATAIRESTGSRLADQFIMSIIKDASDSCPPIPNYLRMELISIRCNWPHINLEQGPTNLIIA